MHCMEKARMHNRSDVAADPQIVWAGYCNSLDIAILCYTFSLQKGANAKMCNRYQKQGAGANLLAWSRQDITFFSGTHLAGIVNCAPCCIPR